ncbi:MAG TPA: hypothetical protein VNL77_24600, partial [Roseiflexaceae bacterium]|nr:hypothetical protein [Roseiflexaceae bacterium]
MNDLDGISGREVTAALDGTRAPRAWLARLADVGLGLEALARAANTIDAFRRRPPLGELDPLAALGRAPATPAAQHEQAGDEAAQRAQPPPPAHAHREDQGAGRPVGVVLAPHGRRPRAQAVPPPAGTPAAQALPVDRLQELARGGEQPPGARAAKLPAWARSNGKPERKRAQAQAVGASPAGGSGARPPAHLDVGGALLAMPGAMIPSDGAPATRAASAPPTNGQAASNAGGALLDRLVRAAARALVPPGANDAAERAAQALAGALGAPVGGPGMPV